MYTTSNMYAVSPLWLRSSPARPIAASWRPSTAAIASVTTYMATGRQCVVAGVRHSQKLSRRWTVLEITKPYASVDTALALPEAMRFCAPLAIVWREEWRSAWRPAVAGPRRKEEKRKGAPLGRGP